MNLIYKQIPIKKMWPFKKKGKILIKCSFPRFCDEDQQFIVRGLIEDLKKDYGNCYDFEVQLERGFYPDKDSVEIKGQKSDEIRNRALKIEIYRRIKELK